MSECQNDTAHLLDITYPQAKIYKKLQILEL
jgi:hypothetical protein